MPGQPSNTLKGKIKSVVVAPPYEIVTVALDPNVAQEITVAHIPIPGGASFASFSASNALVNDDGNGDNGGDVTVTVPVPNAVIVMGS